MQHSLLRFRSRFAINGLRSCRPQFGRVTVESMLGKCLVVGAASGATTELIQDGVNGILYQPDDEADFCKKLTACIEQFDKYAFVTECGGNLY